MLGSHTNNKCLCVIYLGFGGWAPHKVKIVRIKPSHMCMWRPQSSPPFFFFIVLVKSYVRMVGWSALELYPQPDNSSFYFLFLIRMSSCGTGNLVLKASAKN